MCNFRTKMLFKEAVTTDIFCCQKSFKQGLKHIFGTKKLRLVYFGTKNIEKIFEITAISTKNIHIKIYILAIEDSVPVNRLNVFKPLLQIVCSAKYKPIIVSSSHC